MRVGSWDRYSGRSVWTRAGSPGGSLVVLGEGLLTSLVVTGLVALGVGAAMKRGASIDRPAIR